VSLTKKWKRAVSETHRFAVIRKVVAEVLFLDDGQLIKLHIVVIVNDLKHCLNYPLPKCNVGNKKMNKLYLNFITNIE
jgi:hypothetical protein